jgi:hypothetical protein
MGAVGGGWGWGWFKGGGGDGIFDSAWFPLFQEAPTVRMVLGRCILARVGLSAVLLAATAAAIPITFTGNVANDFDDQEPSVFVVTDTAPPVLYPRRGSGSGWNIVDIRFSYDQATDTAFFGARGVHLLRAQCVGRHSALGAVWLHPLRAGVFTIWRCPPAPPPHPFPPPACQPHVLRRAAPRGD